MEKDQAPDKIDKGPNPKKKWALPEWFPRITTNRILAITTIIIAFIAFLQWCATEKLDKTSRLRDRAYIFFSNPTIEPWPPPPQKSTTWRILINVGNTGNMPAQNVLIQYAVVNTDKRIDDPWPMAKWIPTDTPKFINAKQALILQGGGIPLDTYEKARNFKTNIYILMEAKYIDGFDLDKTRITQACRSWRFDTQGYTSLGFAGSHNCIDDDCN